jgi:hypothetical protein
MKLSKKNVGYLLALTSASALIAVMAIAVALPMGALFGSESKVQAQTVARSYTAESQLQPGMVVQLAGDKTTVKAVTEADASKMLGIVIQPNDAPLSLSESAAAGQQVYVATNGTYKLLVSNQNGVINKGDYVVISSIDGVAMKANDKAQYVVGKTLQAFDGKTSVLSQTVVKDSKGESHTVTFGAVSVDINVGRNPLQKTAAPPASSLPGFIQKASESIANKSVTPVRVYISLAVLLITAVIVCTVLYAGIRSSMTSLGRNPLARKGIMRNLLQIVLVGIIILIVGLFAVYLLLKL